MPTLFHSARCAPWSDVIMERKANQQPAVGGERGSCPVPLHGDSTPSTTPTVAVAAALLACVTAV
jgi:hypothetical protein